MDWRGKKVLVTGGASFIGSNLVDALIEVHTEPRDGLYRRVARYGLDDVIRSDRFPDLDVPVVAVLKPAKT